MDLKDLDCRKMYFDPKANSVVKTLSESIPNIGKRRVAPIKQINLFKYIMLMYDPFSPLVKDVPNWWARKFEAIEAAGFKIKDDNTLTLPTENMLLGKNKKVNDAIIDFLAYVNRPTWNQIIFINETILNLTQEALGGARGNSTDIDKISKLQKSLAEATKELVGENLMDDTKAFKRQLYHRLEEARLSIRPEDYAKTLAGGDDLMADSPYGDLYAIQRIKLIGDSKNVKR